MSGSMHGLEACPSGSTGNPLLGTARTRSRDRLRLLAEAIEGEIVPRLVAEYETPPHARHVPLPANWHEAEAISKAPVHDAAIDLVFAPVPQEAVNLAVLSLSENEATVRDYVSAAVGRMGLEPVCLDLLAPAARHLGDLWNEDICSFTDVTIGLMRLQSALLAVTMPAQSASTSTSPRRAALLAPAQGDQHTFGLTMVAGFLERAGWTVTQLSEGSPATIEAALRSQWYGVLGVSAGSGAKLQNLQRMLPRLRAMSRNPDLGVMVGGPLFVAQPSLAAEIGADSTAPDGPQAVQAAEALIAPRRIPRVATG